MLESGKHTLLTSPLRLARIRSVLLNLLTSQIKKLQSSGGVVVHKATQKYAVILSNKISDSASKIAILAPQNQVNHFAC